MNTKTLPMLLIALAALTTPAFAAPPADAPRLVHRFELPAGLAWGKVSIPLAPQAWRVGHVEGPAATEAQLRAALAELGEVEIGAQVAGWVEGPTAYPGGLAVRALEPGARFEATATGLDSSDAPRHRLPGTDSAAFRASGLIAPVLDRPRFVSVAVPQRHLAAPDNALQFEIRAVSNRLVPSQFDRASGVVALRAASH